ncbi:MAG: phosphoglucosamine mutase, partial [Halomonas venusta]|nr:phosphoglucosamine mutase [Halomonas venusta]
GMSNLPQTLITVRFATLGGHDPLSTPLVKQVVADVEASLGSQGRVLLRKSGTEPLIRVMVEAVDAEQAQSSAQQIADSLV